MLLLLLPYYGWENVRLSIIGTTDTIQTNKIIGRSLRGVTATPPEHHEKESLLATNAKRRVLWQRDVEANEGAITIRTESWKQGVYIMQGSSSSSETVAKLLIE